MILFFRRYDCKEFALGKNDGNGILAAKNCITFYREPYTMIAHVAHLMIVLSLFVCSSCAKKPVRIAGPRSTVTPLAETIENHIGQSRFERAAWGVKVISLDSGATLYEHNAEKCLLPASQVKLFTCALALEKLGPDFTVKTSLYAKKRPDAEGILRGDLLIYGRGDPMIGARLPGGGFANGFDRIIEQLSSAGVKKIDGNLIADESSFATPPWGSGLEWKDLQESYGAESSALGVYENGVDLSMKPGGRLGEPCVITTDPSTAYLQIVNRTETAPRGAKTTIRVYRPLGENRVYVIGGIAIDSAEIYKRALAVHNPALFFVTQLKEALEEKGIAVTGGVRVIDAPYRETHPLNAADYTELGSVESPPIRDMVRVTLKSSQNMFAQHLLLLVGVYGDSLHEDAKQKSIISVADRWLTTEERGLAQLYAFVHEIGIDPAAFFVEEGAGLSRKNLITPNAIITLFTHMDKGEHADLFRDSLPIAGVDGKLIDRMRGTAAENNVCAKTGTMRHTSMLSGYVMTADGERLLFSLMLNNYFNPRGPINLREDIDVIPVWLAENKER